MFDICIIGTGASGGILAYKLAQAGLKVCSLEAGGHVPLDYFTNDRLDDVPLTKTEKSKYGEHVQDVVTNRAGLSLLATNQQLPSSEASRQQFEDVQLYQVSGKQNLWGGVTLRYGPRDFKLKQHHEADVDWPISYEDVEPFYRQVEQLMPISGKKANDSLYPDCESYLSPWPLNPVDEYIVSTLQGVDIEGFNIRRSRMAVETRTDRTNVCQQCGLCCNGCRYGSTYRFSNQLLPKILHLSNYHLITNAKVKRLLLASDHQQIEKVEYIDVKEKSFHTLQAKCFILCTGAIETPRILFNSAQEAFPKGLANRSGLLGCYLQDSLLTSHGGVILPLIPKMSQKKYQNSIGYGVNLIIPRYFYSENIKGGFVIQMGHGSRQTVPTMLKYAPWFIPKWTVKRYLWAALYGLTNFGMPEAVISNRVIHSQETDHLGIPRVDVYYQHTENDTLLLQKMLKDGKRFSKMIFGPFSQNKIKKPGTAIHCSGTCRMATNPKEGVVDADGRCFDHPNLFISDSSIFPTQSEKHITLTVMALAAKLGDYLSQKEFTPQ